jgi:hypothetical protein
MYHTEEFHFLPKHNNYYVDHVYIHISLVRNTQRHNDVFPETSYSGDSLHDCFSFCLYSRFIRMEQCEYHLTFWVPSVALMQEWEDVGHNRLLIPYRQYIQHPSTKRNFLTLSFSQWYMLSCPKVTVWVLKLTNSMKLTSSGSTTTFRLRGVWSGKWQRHDDVSWDASGRHGSCWLTGHQSIIIIMCDICLVGNANPFNPLNTTCSCDAKIGECSLSQSIC